HPRRARSGGRGRPEPHTGRRGARHRQHPASGEQSPRPHARTAEPAADLRAQLERHEWPQQRPLRALQLAGRGRPVSDDEPAPLMRTLAPILLIAAIAAALAGCSAATSMDGAGVGVGTSMGATTTTIAAPAIPMSAVTENQLRAEWRSQVLGDR